VVLIPEFWLIQGVNRPRGRTPVPSRPRQAQRRIGVTPLGSEALPSFASQTGQACTACHVVGFGPALTRYGRQFKLNGYVYGGGSLFIPLAGFVQLGFTNTGANQPTPPAPGFGVNNDFSLDQVSAFYGGRIAPNVGAFVQVRRRNWSVTPIVNGRSCGCAR
jgi:hypothetical protein